LVTTTAGGEPIGSGRRSSSTGTAVARPASELTRRAGRSSASLTSVTSTGVIAVAMTVPGCQILETTVAATTAEIAATINVPR
jgi:hypothetical protein